MIGSEDTVRGCGLYKVGYAGQRYEVRFELDGKIHVFGWTNDPTGGALVASINAHPEWIKPQVIDLKESGIPEEPHMPHSLQSAEVKLKDGTGLTISVKITKQFRLRVCIGTWFIKLGARIMKCKFEIQNSPIPTRSAPDSSLIPLPPPPTFSPNGSWPR